jgi:hypothetical protein
MTEELSIFRRFPSPAQAIELIELLHEVDIKAVLGDNRAPVDVTFAGNTHQDMFEVRIAPTDFEKAEALLEKVDANLADHVPKDYYLFAFSDDELYDILVKPDEWGDLDYSLAQQLLAKRGKPVDEQELKALKDARISQVSKPEKSNRPWIIAGYIFAVFGGFLGIIIGYFLWTSKKTLPNGQKVYSYNTKDRKDGKIIFFIGLIFFVVGLLLKVLIPLFKA